MNIKMDNKDIKTKARLLIGEALINEDTAKLLKKLNEKQVEVFRHSINVAYLTAEACLNTQMFSHDIKDVVTGALLHDIGKLRIPNEILFKKERLTDEEYELIKKHSMYGYEMIKDMDFSDITKEIVLSHHEKMDGTGYPNHKRGKDIPKEVQIVTVCDMYDALTEKRSYGEENSAYNAIRIMANENNISDMMFMLLASLSDK